MKLDIGGLTHIKHIAYKLSNLEKSYSRSVFPNTYVVKKGEGIVFVFPNTVRR